MNATYDFHDEWYINAPLEATWEGVSNSASWQKWWPDLKSAVVTNMDSDIVNSKAKLIWRSKTGYELAHVITIKALTMHKSIEFTSEGDLEGYGSWSFESVGGATRMEIDWHVETTKSWMNILSPFLRPLFALNHHALMNQGEKGLNKYLKK